jgi:hypothetical protein
MRMAGSRSPTDSRSQSQRFAVPVAIVVAGALVGIGMFFGLRANGAHSPSETPAVPAVPVPAQDVLLQQAKDALDAQRAMLTEKCWVPAIKDQPDPHEIGYVFDFTFDAQGRQIMRGTIENRATARPAVTSCVADALLPIVIPAPGASVRIEVPFRLP